MKTLIEITDKEFGRKEMFLEMVGMIPNQSYCFSGEYDVILEGLEKRIYIDNYFNSLKQSKRILKMQIHNFYIFKNRRNHSISNFDCTVSGFEWERNRFYVEFENSLGANLNKWINEEN